MIIRIPNLYRINPANFVYLLIFLTPFSFYNIDLIWGLGVTPINIYTMILIIIALIITIHSNAIRLPPITNNFHFGYILIILTSSIYAVNQSGTISGILAYIIKFYPCFLFPILYLRNRNQIETVVYIFIFAGLLNALMGWVELVGFYGFGKIIIPPFGESFFTTTKAYGFVDRGGIGAFGIPGFMRMYGFMSEGANTFGTYMLVPFGLSLYLLNKNKTVFNWLLSIIFGLTIFFSVSRNAIIGLIILVFSIPLIKAINSGRLLRLIARIFIGVFIIFTVIAFAFIVEEKNLLPDNEIKINENITILKPTYLLTRFNPFSSISMGKSLRFFTDHLRIAILYSTDNFGFGMGLQNFDNYVYKHHRSEIIGYSSHSNFITFLGDTGIWGLLIQICIIILTIRYGIISYFKQVGKDKDSLSLYLTSIFIALVITGIVRTYYLDTYTFIVMGLITVLYMINKKTNINNLRLSIIK